MGHWENDASPEKSSIIGTMQYLIAKNCNKQSNIYTMLSNICTSKNIFRCNHKTSIFEITKGEEFNLHNKTEQQEIISTLKS